MVKAAALAEAAAVVVVVMFRVLGCLSLPPLVEVAAAAAWAVVVRTRSKGRGYGQGHFSPLVVTTSGFLFQCQWRFEKHEKCRKKYR